MITTNFKQKINKNSVLIWYLQEQWSYKVQKKLNTILVLLKIKQTKT